jgi:cytochrome c peroxidase
MSRRSTSRFDGACSRALATLILLAAGIAANESARAASDSAPPAAANAAITAMPAFTREEREIIASLRAEGTFSTDRTNSVLGDRNARELGRLLFFDKRLSRSGEIACASCHDPARNWTDGRRVARGAREGSRNTPTLWNVARRRWYFWDGRADTLWSQALVPIEGASELASDRAYVVAMLLSDARLRALYRQCFGDPPAALRHALQGRGRGGNSPARTAAPSPEINAAFANVGKALAAFESTLERDQAPFDTFAEGLATGDADKQQAMSESAKRGLKTFIGRGNCILCHSGPELTDEEFHDDRVPARDGTRALDDNGRLGGLAWLKSAEFTAAGEYSDDRQDPRARLTGFQRLREDARGQFRTPSLRNVALTAPYMHAGQFPTLQAVVEFYSRMPPAHDAGFRGETLLGPLNLSAEEIADLVSFLEALTGTHTTFSP